MIKKGVLALAALVGLFSGASMVSAYEAHVINVKAHVENAMHMSTYHIDYGTVFPEEWQTRQLSVLFSSSFCNQFQTRVEIIDYNIYVTDKPGYLWLGDALYIGDVDKNDDGVEDQPGAKYPTIANPPGLLAPVDPPAGPLPDNLPSTSPNGNATRPILVHSGKLNKGPGAPGCPFNLGDTITIGLDAPVFEGYWNQYTDVLGCDPDSPTGPKKPSRLCVPSVLLTGARNVPDGIDLGVDLVVQVMKIYKFERCTNGIDDDLDGLVDEGPAGVNCI